MKVSSIDTENIVPVEYSHTHDSKILFRKYRENFDFGLTVDQYYFNEDAKDKKTNYNTQYTLTNLYPLSTIAELDIPFSEKAVSVFSTTIKHGDKYLKTSKSGVNLNSAFVASTQFDPISSRFLFTFTLTAIPATGTDTLSGSVPKNTAGFEDRVLVSTEYDSTIYYLQALSATNTAAVWTSAAALTEQCYFRYGIADDKITLLNPASGFASKICTNANILSLSTSPGTFTTAATLSTACFDIVRYTLTKNFKYIPNSYSKYISSYNTDTVDLDTSTVVDHISNNYFVYTNNFNFYDSKTTSNENKITTHADFFPLKNQATLHEYYAQNNHFNSEPTYLNRVYEKVNAGTNQQRGYDKIGLSYNIGTYDIIFKPNKLTYFTTPDSMAPYTILNIKDSKLETLGAVAGDNPLMSDKVFKRRENVKNNSFSDDPDPVYLCSWLSGSSTGDRKWIDRYYNPAVSDFSNALSGTSHYNVITAAGAQSTETFDVSSSLTFEPNNDYIFYHVGDKDYNNLFKAYNTKYNVAENLEYINYKGVPTAPNKVKEEDELILDGETFGRFNTDTTGDFSTSFWLHTKDNTLPFGYQIAGNYFDEGFGIFNTDLVTPNIILPVENVESGLTSKLLFLNNDFEIYDEVIVMDGPTEIEIKGIGRKDNFSEFYVLGTNNIIYVYNANNNQISQINNIGINQGWVDINEPQNKQFTSSVSGTHGDCEGKWAIDGHKNIDNYADWEMGDIQFDGGLNDTVNGVNYSGWNWSNGIAEHVVNPLNTALSADNLYQNIGAIEGENIRVTLTISERTAGSIRVFVGTTQPTPPYWVPGLTENRTHTVINKASKNTPKRLFIQASHDFVGKVDNINVQRYLEPSTIDDFEVGEDKLHVLFNPIKSNPNCFTYNFKNNKTSGPVTSTYVDKIGEKGKVVATAAGKTFYSVDSKASFGNEMSFDNDGNAYVVRRSNKTAVGDTRNYLQKLSIENNLEYNNNDNLIKSGLNLESKINGVQIDDDNNTIVLHDNNIISILDSDRILKVTREFCQLENYPFQQSYIDMIYDFEDGVYKKYILFIQEYNDGFRLTKLNDRLRIISTKKFRNLNLASLKLTKSVTSFYYLRKTGANKNRLKVLLKTKPKFSSTGVIPKTKTTIDFDYTQLNPGYNHFFVNVSVRKGYMELYVNSRLFSKVEFPSGMFSLDNVLGTGTYIGAVSTPFYLTLANRLLQPKKYFIKNVKIKSFKMYNKVMTYFDMLAHYNYHFEDKNLIWSYPIGQRTYIDTIDKLMKFNYPEKITNNYKVEIENTGITDNKLKDKLKERITEELQKITPYFDEVKDIVIS